MVEPLEDDHDVCATYRGYSHQREMREKRWRVCVCVCGERRVMLQRQLLKQRQHLTAAAAAVTATAATVLCCPGTNAAKKSDNLSSVTWI